MPYKDPRPAHERIAAELRAQIMDGTLAGKLPVTNELTERFKVVNSTITKALASLRDEGLIYSERGRFGGVFAADWTAFVTDAAAYIEPDDRIEYTRADVTEVDAPGDVARILGEERAVVRSRLMLVDGDPAEISDSYVPVQLARDLGLDQPGRLRGGMRTVLAEAGLPHRRFTDVISAREPTPREMTALRLPLKVPVLRILRTIMTDGDRIVGVDVICKGAHRYPERYSRDVR
jgi:GntR family transcriptional regulator